MYLIFIVGTAGSGKSHLTAAFSDWLKLKKQNVTCVNLDPGVLRTPYTPEVDVRDFISIDDLMEKYELGPNGALVMAADLIATEIDSIKKEIEELNSDYVLIDTPGQMELFAFRASGPYIVNELTTDPKAMVYLFDAPFCIDPMNYASNMFLATAVHSRFLVPQVYALSKADLIPKRELKKIIDWGTRTDALENAIEAQASDTKRLLSHGITRLISRIGLSFTLTPISSTEETGFINLHAILMRIFAGGEEVI
ncbi:MAG: GPN-loop GTPase [Thermoproteota archaeon]|nr:GPN-loop GTPase [Thermoproteota archaeon]